jgi:hypothetical protein
LLPKEFTTVIDVAGFLSSGQVVPPHYTQYFVSSQALRKFSALMNNIDNQMMENLT